MAGELLKRRDGLCGVQCGRVLFEDVHCGMRVWLRKGRGMGEVKDEGVCE